MAFKPRPLRAVPWLWSILGLPCLIALSGCAHSYYYLPEIDGEGAIHGRKGGIIYTIPPTGTPELTLRVRALGIHKGAKDTLMLGMRMSFIRPKQGAPTAGAQEYLKPEEQILRMAGGQEIRPAYIHTMAKRNDRIDLTGKTHEVVEFLYPIPKTGDGGVPTIETYSFQWRIHYGADGVESQAPRFDRYDARPQQAAEMYPEDPDYPYDVSPLDLPGWTVIRDPFWWAVDPWWLWW